MNPIAQWRKDLGLSESEMSRYLGVPVSTLRKWINGTRTPDAAPQRLFDILWRIEREALALHEDLIEEARSGVSDQPVSGFVPAVDTDAPSDPENGSETVPSWLTGAVG